MLRSFKQIGLKISLCEKMLHQKILIQLILTQKKMRFNF